MKNLLPLTALALIPFTAALYAGDACCAVAATADVKNAPAVAKSADHQHKPGETCSAEHDHTEHDYATPTHEHGEDITLPPALVTKFGIVAEKVGPGKIARTTLATGALVKDETLAKSPSLVVHAKVSERAAAKFKAGETHLRVASSGAPSCEAVFHSIAPESTSAKGFVTARFLVENIDGKLEAGARAECRLVTAEKPFTLTVPRDAIQGMKGKTFVYIEEEPGVYEKHPVVVVDSDELRAAITGLNAGEAVVTKGASVNAALDAAHGHSHGPNGEEPGHHEDHDHDHDHADHAGHQHAKPQAVPGK